MSAFIGITIQETDKATPVLAALRHELTDRTGLHKYIGAAAESGTRLHVRQAAVDRHVTADKLGARRSGYLTKRAELVEGTGDATQATLKLTGHIFKRAFGPVTVRASAGKMLTIPMRAEAYGKRAREFDDIFIIRAKQGRAFLARKVATGRVQFLYLLKSFVILPQDRGLLPSQSQFEQLAELAARSYLRKRLREAGL